MDYSQKQLISQALKKSRRHAKLQIYALLTGMVSILISLIAVIIEAVKK